MQKSPHFCNSVLRQVNINVLKMINHKKYPLNQQKLQQIQHHKKKYNINKLHTRSNSSSTTLYTLSNSPHKQKEPEIVNEHSMGELFQHQQTRRLMLNKIGNSQLEQISQNINNYVWSKKKQLFARLESQDQARNKQIDKPDTRQNLLIKRRSINRLNSFISRLRKRMKEDFMRDSQAIDNPIERYSSSDNQREPISERGMNFFQGSEQILEVMKRYPLKPHQTISFKENHQKTFQKDMAEEIRSSLTSDKFSRMRITINHRKIVSIR